MEAMYTHLLQLIQFLVLLNIITFVVIQTESVKITLKLPRHSTIINKKVYGKDSSLDYIYHATCTYNGKTYASGEFQLSKCVSCICNGTSGQVRCVAKSCRKIDNCVEYDVNTSDCCPRCLQYGCFHDGILYKAGARIDNNQCTKCFCPWTAREKEGARVKCLTIQCHQPACVDSIVPQGKCCAICPNGANCLLEKQVISEGERIYVDRCRYCYCARSTLSATRTRDAVCERSFFCI